MLDWCSWVLGREINPRASLEGSGVFSRSEIFDSERSTTSSSFDSERSRVSAGPFGRERKPNEPRAPSEGPTREPPREPRDPPPYEEREPAFVSPKLPPPGEGVVG